MDWRMPALPPAGQLFSPAFVRGQGADYFAAFRADEAVHVFDNAEDRYLQLAALEQPCCLPVLQDVLIRRFFRINCLQAAVDQIQFRLQGRCPVLQEIFLRRRIRLSLQPEAAAAQTAGQSGGLDHVPPASAAETESLSPCRAVPGPAEAATATSEGVG